MSRTPKVLLLVTDAGGGHRASANALKDACGALNHPLDVRVVNVYREVWDKAEPLGRFTGVYGEDIYNFVLKHSLLGLASVMRRTARLASRAPNPRALKDGVAWLKRENPDLCVSLMPFVNDMHARICAEAGVPLALVMTDLVDTKPYIWYTPQACCQATWVAAPCAQAAAQARESGAVRVLESGLLLHPKYYDPRLRSLDRKTARRELGLEENRTTVLLNMGGFGGSAMEDLVANLEPLGEGLQIVAVCGRNEALFRRLEARAAQNNGRHRLVPLGYTQELHRYLRAADLMTGKPGPASLFEAVAAATPLVLDAASTMPQEVPNAVLAESKGLAWAVHRREDLLETVLRLAADTKARATMEAIQRAYPLPDTARLLARAVAESAFALDRSPRSRTNLARHLAPNAA